MALIDLWKKDKNELSEKHIQQVIAFAGDGKLSDNSTGSAEFREYLRNIPSDWLARYSEECLAESFPRSGQALQDIVNEIGRRLEFAVTHGLYQGTASQIGNDGIWKAKGDHCIVIEVKTTDAFRINLDSIAEYRRKLAAAGTISLDKSSILIVVGRQDTGGLEAQIRGSRHAWDMRLISIEALLRMLRLKEEVEDPSILSRIHGILIPREFTRLDPILEIAFAAVEDITQEPVQPVDEEGHEEDKKFTPVAFHAQCISRIEAKLGVTLVKQSRASFATADDSVRVLCAVSRYHEKNRRFWFAFHPHQAEFLSATSQGYVAFGCGDAKTLFLIPFTEFKPWLDNFNKTEKPNRFYWHVKIRETEKSFSMIGRSGTKPVDITKYLIK